MKKEMVELLDEMVIFQEKKLMKIGSQIIPHLTTDDMLQPNDFPELENHPEFRFEEGVLKGIHTARSALLARDLS
ncbi:MAG: hypothetical protein SNF33_06705 [Candidatus Algichlamydia australiensis]|nr:hypothetical protein [Chlamydiales bacterium]